MPLLETPAGVPLHVKSTSFFENHFQRMCSSILSRWSPTCYFKSLLVQLPYGQR